MRLRNTECSMVEENMKRLNVLGMPVDDASMPEIFSYVDSLIKEGKRDNYILAVNPEKIMALRKGRFSRDMFEKASVLIPDGIGVVLAIRLLYGVKAERVTGVDLMHGLCREAAVRGHKIFIYGSREEVNRNAADKIKDMYPGISIVGRSHGYVSDGEMDSLVRKINDSGADILFVALGSPKQEEWIQKYLPRLDIKLCQAVGGTLDTITSRVKRAPVLMQKLGLEWFYRLVKEPTRIYRMRVLPLFAYHVIKDKFRL